MAKVIEFYAPKAFRKTVEAGSSAAMRIRSRVLRSLRSHQARKDRNTI